MFLSHRYSRAGVVSKMPAGKVTRPFVSSRLYHEQERWMAYTVEHVIFRVSTTMLRHTTIILSARVQQRRAAKGQIGNYSLFHFFPCNNCYPAGINQTSYYVYACAK